MTTNNIPPLVDPAPEDPTIVDEDPESPTDYPGPLPKEAP